MSIGCLHILVYVCFVHYAYLCMYVRCGIIRKTRGGENMAKPRTSAAVKNRYAAKAYDRVSLIVPKGRKADIEAHAKSKGESVNGFISELIRSDMGLSEAEWKNSEEG